MYCTIAVYIASLFFLELYVWLIHYMYHCMYNTAICYEYDTLTLPVVYGDDNLLCWISLTQVFFFYFPRPWMGYAGRPDSSAINDYCWRKWHFRQLIDLPVKAYLSVCLHFNSRMAWWILIKPSPLDALRYYLEVALTWAFSVHTNELNWGLIGQNMHNYYIKSTHITRSVQDLYTSSDFLFMDGFWFCKVFSPDIINEEHNSVCYFEISFSKI